MNRYEKGMLAISRAGHDRGQVYVLLHVEGDYVYLTDGRLKTIQNPKKKNIRHIQIMRDIPDELIGIADGYVKDEDIRKVIRRFINV